MSAPASEPSAEAVGPENIGDIDIVGEIVGDIDSAAECAEPVAEAEAPGENAVELDAHAEREALTEQLQATTAERDEYLDQLQRQRAEFQNFRRRMESDRKQQIAAGVSRLVESLLPVLDGCDAAVQQGHTEVAAVGQALMVALEKAGLERIDAVGEAFDPTLHEAITIEHAPEPPDEPSNGAADLSAADGEVLADDPSDDESGSMNDSDERSQIVTAELRSGFRFDGRVLRAAMVKVRTA